MPLPAQGRVGCIFELSELASNTQKTYLYKPMSFDPFAEKDAAKAPDEREAEVGEPEVLVRRSDEDVAPFDSQRIVDALVREASVDLELARKISAEVRSFIQKIGFRALSSSLIRGLVDAKLLELGLEDAHRSHTRLGVPFYDVDRIMYDPFRQSTLQPGGPEGTSLMLAEAIKREYSILRVFSEPTANAHLVGDIHIHRIGAIDRPHSITSSIDYVKRFGIALPQGFANSRPARHAEVLMTHIVKLSAALQGYLAGPVAWDSLNYAVAPFLEGLDDRAIKQTAQALVFELSAPAVARGGHVVSVDLHVDCGCPAYMEQRNAIGPGGAEANRAYADYSREARRFLEALLEVLVEGDAEGRGFFSPRLILRAGDEIGSERLLMLASQLVTERGGLTIVLDRNSGRAFFDRYGIPDDLARGTETDAWRSSQFQVISLNLPRVGYLAGGRQVRVFEELSRLMEVAAQAHLEKRVFLEKLLALGDRGPLAALAMRRSRAPLVKLGWTTHAIGIVGLDELCRTVLRSGIHESEEAKEFAVKVLTHIKHEAERLSNKHNARFTLNSESSESASHRLAQLDLRFFGDTAAEVVRGRATPTAAYYTDGVRLPSGGLEIEARISVEGELHRIGIRNAATEVRLGDLAIGPEDLGKMLSEARQGSSCSALVFCPEFTVCLDCGSQTRGRESACQDCGSIHVDTLAYEGERYSYASGWTEARRAELCEQIRTSAEEA